MSDAISYEQDAGVATVTLDDGKVNALGVPVLEALHAHLDRAEADGDAVVLTGRTGMFSAGFDLKTFAAGGAELLRMLELGSTLCERILGFPRPVVIAASGHAMAAGAFLLLAADVRIGAEGDFRVGLNETQIGLTLPWSVIEVARYRIPPSHREAAIVAGTIYGPRDAIAPGFLDRVVAPDAVLASAQEEAARLGAFDPGAYAGNKLRLRGPAVEAVRAGTQRMVEELGALR